MTTKNRIQSSVFILLTLVLGCSEGKPDGDEVVPIASIPANLMEIANKELPGIDFTEAFKMKVDGKDAFEIRGKDKRGKVREIELSLTGEVLEIE
ncbi:MAG: hypothetical protein WCJ40_17740 [Planctomycetota bacterium]